MRLAFGLLALALALPACGRDERMALRSPAFEDGQRIPVRHSCEGDNVSPPLSWTRVPDAATELALVVGDPDADGGVFHHWVVLGIAAEPAVVAAGEVPPGAVQAKGGSENPTWIGPCPPIGEEHDYVFTLFPLSERLSLPDGVELATALDAIADARIPDEEAVLQGRFRR